MKQILALGMVVGLLIAIGCDQPSPQIPPYAKATVPPASGGPVVGTLAPEIVGVDLEGVEFKLSDYKGQVIMLDFYGDW